MKYFTLPSVSHTQLKAELKKYLRTKKIPKECTKKLLVGRFEPLTLMMVILRQHIAWQDISWQGGFSPHFMNNIAAI